MLFELWMVLTNEMVSIKAREVVRGMRTAGHAGGLGGEHCEGATAVGSNGGNENGNVETATSWCGQGGEFLSGEQVEDFVSGVLLRKRDLFRLEYDISVA